MIRFLAKVAAQRAIGRIPGGARLYPWLQHRIIGSTRLTDDLVAHKVAMATRLVGRLRDAGASRAGRHLEIGTGWHPVLPLVLWRHGMADRQLLTDVVPVLRADDLARLAGLVNDQAAGDRHLPPVEGAPERWLTALGIDYAAPCRPPFPPASASVDLVTANQVLMYPPPEAVADLFAEAARLLRPGGLFAAETKLYDLYSHADPRLPRFNFLRYGHARWRDRFDNPITPLNRLRSTDFAAIVAALPFEVLVWSVEGGGPDDMAELMRAPPHPDFDGYPSGVLAQTGLAFLLRRR